jgi:hypothetical protein
MVNWISADNAAPNDRCNVCTPFRIVKSDDGLFYHKVGVGSPNGPDAAVVRHMEDDIRGATPWTKRGDDTVFRYDFAQQSRLYVVRDDVFVQEDPGSQYRLPESLPSDFAALIVSVLARMHPRLSHCVVCLSDERPNLVSLPCGHGVCDICGWKLARSSQPPRKIPCPECRQLFEKDSFNQLLAYAGSGRHRVNRQIAEALEVDEPDTIPLVVGGDVSATERMLRQQLARRDATIAHMQRLVDDIGNTLRRRLTFTMSRTNANDNEEDDDEPSSFSDGEPSDNSGAFTTTDDDDESDGPPAMLEPPPVEARSPPRRPSPIQRRPLVVRLRRRDEETEEGEENGAARGSSRRRLR